MLAKQRRIDSATIRTLTKPNKIIRTECLQVLYFSTPAVWQVSVVVSKKVSKQAVQRNRIRRSLYGALEKWQEITPAGYYIVRVQSSAAREPLATLRTQLHTAFGQLPKAR